jgi:Na+/phosphate symporter
MSNSDFGDSFILVSLKMIGSGFVFLTDKQYFSAQFIHCSDLKNVSFGINAVLGFLLLANLFAG